MKIDFYNLDTIENKDLKYAVIGATYKGKIVFVKHKERETWEIPGGRREEDERIDETGIRELKEETGAIDFDILPICEYSVTRGDECSYGRLFYSEIFSFGELPDLEIGEVKLFDVFPSNLTYPDIQPFLYEKIIELKPSKDSISRNR